MSRGSEFHHQAFLPYAKMPYTMRHPLRFSSVRESERSLDEVWKISDTECREKYQAYKEAQRVYLQKQQDYLVCFERMKLEQDKDEVRSSIRLMNANMNLGVAFSPKATSPFKFNSPKAIEKPSKLHSQFKQTTSLNTTIKNLGDEPLRPHRNTTEVEQKIVQTSEKSNFESLFQKEDIGELKKLKEYVAEAWSNASVKSPSRMINNNEIAKLEIQEINHLNILKARIY